MKQNNKCTKCGSVDLLRIPIIPGEEPHIVVGERPMHMVAVTKFICGQCGFIEEWVESTDDLAKLRTEYGHE